MKKMFSNVINTVNEAKDMVVDLYHDDPTLTIVGFMYVVYVIVNAFAC